MNKPFKGLKVVELASVLAGPTVGMFFAELGAKVIKIENPNTKGDVTRSWKLPSESQEVNVSAYWSSCNYQKDHLLLNLKKENELLKVKTLLADCDILLTNYKHGTDKKLGLEYETLKKHNPQLIHCHLTGFTSDIHRTAYDVVIQAETGYMSMNGTPESGPTKMPLALMDLLAAHQMKEAIMIALWQREKTGEGLYIEVSLEKSGIAGLANQATNFLMNNHIPKPIGSLHPNIAPYGDTFLCKDGKSIVLAVGSDIHFQKLCIILGDGSLGEHEQFLTNSLRVTNRKNLQFVLGELFKSKNQKELLEELLINKVPAGAIKNMKEVFDNPVAKDMILSEEVDGMMTKRVSTIAFDIRTQS